MQLARVVAAVGLLSIAATTAGPSLADSSPTTTEALAARVSVQVANPILGTVVRVTLDGAVIFEGAPKTSTASNIPVLTSVAGSFDLKPGTHTLVAQVVGQRVKASLRWRPTPGTESWVVIHHETVAPDAVEPPYLTFSLQPRPYKLR